MESRYQEMLRLSKSAHQDGCPVFLEAGALLRDNVSGKMLAQLRLKNLSAHNVVSCKVEVRASAVNGDPLEGVTYQFMDITIGNDQVFGSKTPIYLPDENTRRIEVIIREVVQEPFRVWTAQSDAVSVMPAAARLSTVLEDERHIARYAARVGTPCDYVPQLQQGLFLCTCGKVNLAEDGACVKCGRTYEELSKALDPDAIRAEVEEQLRIEEEQRLEAERAAEIARQEREKSEAEAAEARRVRMEAARKKSAKIAKIAIPSVIVVVLAIVLTVMVIIPATENGSAYKAAANLLADGAYLDAEQAFLALGDYRDSSDRAKECRYTYADSLRLNGNFEEAIAEWENLGDYSDSAQRAVDALEEWKGADYQDALALKEAGEYISAADAFALLGDYKDAASLQQDCLELQKGMDYAAAMAAADAGDFVTAMDGFLALGSYEDAEALYINAAYAHAEALYTAGNYLDAAEYYRIAIEIDDAEEKAIHSTYQHGIQLCEAGEYAAAIDVFISCIDYSDAAQKLLDAKFGFVQANYDSQNQTTYEYMKELVAANYSGAKKVYADLYAWKVEVVAFNDNPYDSSTNQTSLSKYQYLCVHFKLTGGEPGASTDIRTVLTLPSGQSGSIPHSNMKSGDIMCSYGWYNNPYYGATGNLIFKAYDENNNLLCTASVQVTN